LRRLLVLVFGLPLLCGAACATTQPWTPVVDTYGSSRAQYVDRDMNECRQLAFQVSGHAPHQAVRGAVTGGAVGAATGAAIGAAFGNAGRGAAVGAAAGGIGRGVGQAQRAEAGFQRAYINCMRQRGHRVVN
jgi:outer membrane lipoprotein SlyB